MSDIVPAMPASWVLAPIAELLSPLGDGRVLHHGWSPQCQKVPAKTDHEWGVLKTTSVQPGTFHPEHNKRLPEKLAPRPHLEVRAGDLLLTCAGPRARCGVPCLVRETRPRLILSGKMYRFRARQGLLEPRYLEAYLLASTAQAAIDRMKTGISDSGLNLTHGRFKKLEVVLAPLREQRRIVEAIESYFTRLDDAVGTLERVQRNLNRYRASVLQAAVEGRLVPTEAELARAEGRDYESASVLLERILAERRRRWEEAELAKMKAKGKTPNDDKWKAKYGEPAEPDVAGLPALPDGWCWASIDQLAQLVRNGYSKKPAPEGAVRILRISAVRALSVDFTDSRWLPGAPEDYSRDLVQPGDLLFTRYNGSPALVGVSGLVRSVDQPTVHPDKLIKVRFLDSLLDLTYLELATNTGASREFVESRTRTTAGQAGVSGGDIKQLPVPVPPRTEQRRISDEAERLLTLADSAWDALAANSLRTARLRQSILKWAFEGRLVDQDPTDEPAFALLERIRAERASPDTSKPERPVRRKARSTKA